MLLTEVDLFQNAWVVADLDQAMAQWTKKVGVGPFFVAGHIKVEDYHYRGRPSAIDFSVAIAQAGSMQVELIAQHDDVPSLYHDLYPAGTSGFHHVCHFADDYDRQIAAYVAGGAPVAAQGRFGDMRFAYVDTSPALGFMIEILEESAAMRDHFRMIADAAKGWDGSAPVRPAW
ncbi:MAG TPA: VOC family protein [Stellaceae bacterium]|nr:VOC family protein [Stellaceae bacterium]